MKSRSIPFPAPFVAPFVAIALLAGCASRDSKAANDAVAAQAALDRGNIRLARIQIQRALAVRDDISDYWMIQARISVAGKNLSGAYAAYQNALQFDRANLEALASLCQIALATNAATDAEKYADQLAAINPGSTLPDTVRAAAAMARGDRNKANRYLDQVLAAQPGDPTALIVRARMLADAQDYAGATKAVEQSLNAPGDPTSRLAMLVGLYQRAHDRDGLMGALGRLAQTNADDADIQLRYADLLFDDGKNDAANAAIARAAAAKPNDIGISATALNLWLKQGPDAIPASRLVADASGASLAMKAAYAQFANETGHPDLAIRILGGVAFDSAAMIRPDAAVAAAALAYARGLTGDRAGANALLAGVLQADPDQPAALLARGRLRGAAGDRRGAIEDLRNAVAQDGGNVAARLALADLLLANGDGVLAESALHDGMSAAGDDPRLVARLARLQIARGKRDAATAALADFVRANPLSRRAARVRAG